MRIRTTEAQSRRKRRKAVWRKRYDYGHLMLRRQLAPLVAAGLVDCARCGERIEPGTPWDLGHDDYYPAQHTGPEHAHCNRGAPARNKTSRQW